MLKNEALQLLFKSALHCCVAAKNSIARRAFIASATEVFHPQMTPLNGKKDDVEAWPRFCNIRLSEPIGRGLSPVRRMG